MARVGIAMLAVVLLTGVCRAQKEAVNWTFGFHAGIHFSPRAPVFFYSAINTGEGCATISNGNGQLLFYTDGTRVWNRRHRQMRNGFGLFGHPGSTQSALIVPHPGNDSLYYIFTTDAVECGILGMSHDCGYRGVQCSVVNMKRDNGLGDVVEKNRPLAPVRMHEKLTAVRSAEGSGYWVISHKYGTNEFYEFLVTKAGLDPRPRIVAAGSTLLKQESRLGCLKASSDGKKLAAAYWKDFYELFNFDNRTGAITEPVIIRGERSGEQVGPYGLEFSGNARYLYLSESIAFFGFFSGLRLVGYTIYQYDLAVHDSMTIRQSRYIVDSMASGDMSAWSMQMGPDKRIYISFIRNYLGAITRPESGGAACGYMRKCLVLPYGMSARQGLPNFIQSFLHPAVF